MPRATPAAIILTETEQDELQQIVNRHSSPQQLVQRAKIILLANEGQNNRQIVRSLNVSREMVKLCIKRQWYWRVMTPELSDRRDREIE